MSETSATSFHVRYMCKSCNLVFKSVAGYCSHKVELHFTELSKSRCILFEESVADITGTRTELTKNFREDVVAEDPHILELEDQVCVQVKQEPPDIPNLLIPEVSLLAPTHDSTEFGHSTEIKTEWVEDPLSKYETSQKLNEDLTSRTNSENSSQETEDCIKNEYLDKTRKYSNFSWSDTDVDTDANPSHGQINDRCHDPLENFDVTQSTEPISSSTVPQETEYEYLNENSSGSDDDIICLDDDSLWSTSQKITSLTAEPTATTTGRLNSLILSQLKLECQICSKQFTSSDQLKIHVSICQLYNGKSKAKIKSLSGSSQAIVKRGTRRDRLVKCLECSKLLRPCHLKNHIKVHQPDLQYKAPRARASFVCPICGSTFRRKDYLKAHVRIHSDETPFRCTFPGCDSVFKYKASLYRHSKIHSGSQ